MISLAKQDIYYPGVDSWGKGTVHSIGWNSTEVWGMIGDYDRGSRERSVTGHEVVFNADRTLLVSAKWSVVEERRGG